MGLAVAIPSELPHDALLLLTGTTIAAGSEIVIVAVVTHTDASVFVIE